MKRNPEENKRMSHFRRPNKQQGAIRRAMRRLSIVLTLSIGFLQFINAAARFATQPSTTGG
jgi:hypothetical protein